MRALFLPYRADFNPDTRTYCASGEDSRGEPFGVGAAATIEGCEAALRDYVLEVLDAQAAQGLDQFGNLHDEPPEGAHVAFDPVELLPIRLKLARVTAGLRQADMAERLGITQQAYSRLEGPGANPTVRTLVQAERALGIEVLELRMGTTVKRRKETYKASSADAKRRKKLRPDS